MSEPITRTLESRQEWFCMLICYMKMKTWAMWLGYYPEISYESFELIWPALLDSMLAPATSAVVEKLKGQISLN